MLFQAADGKHVSIIILNMDKEMPSYLIGESLLELKFPVPKVVLVEKIIILDRSSIGDQDLIIV